MIAKYPGKCHYCGKPITVGKDIYDVETKRNWHLACEPQPLPFDQSEAEQLAERLGFRKYENILPK